MCHLGAALWAPSGPLKRMRSPGAFIGPPTRKDGCQVKAEDMKPLLSNKQTAALCRDLGIGAACGDHAAALADTIFQATAHLHGLTKTARPLVSVAGLLQAKGADPDHAPRSAAEWTRVLQRRAPMLSPDQHRVLTEALGLLAACDARAWSEPAERPPGAPPFAIPQRLAAIARIAAALDESGTQDTRVRGVRDDGHAVELLIEGGATVYDNAAAALAAAPLWNRNMLRPVAGVRVSNGGPSSALLLPRHTLGEALSRIVQRQLEQFLVRIYGLRYPEDAEYVHEMRVALRRLRSALRIFRKAIASGDAAFKEEIKTLADVLGTARDTDVFLEFLRAYTDGAPTAHQPSLEIMIRNERAKRRRQYRRAADVLASSEARRFLDRHYTRAHRCGRLELDPRKSRKLLCDQTPRLLDKRLRRVTAFDQPLKRYSSEELHELRIRCKRVRYMAEFFAELYPDGLAELIKLAKKLQDALGAVHDADVYRERVAQWAKRHKKRGSSRRTSEKAVAELCSMLDAQRSKSLRKAVREWNRFTSPKQMTRLRKQIASPRMD